MPTNHTDRMRATIRKHGGLASTADLARRWGVSRQRAAQITGRTDFLKPIGTVGDSPVWLADDCDAWRDRLRAKRRAPVPTGELAEVPERGSFAPTRELPEF